MRKELFLSLLMAGAVASAPDMHASDPIPAGSCRLVLEAHDVFGDGSGGFQWILDSGHETYNNRFFEGFMYFGDYSVFDHMLPADAEANASTDKVVVDGEESVIVPAGIYDWMMIHPDGQNLMYPFGEYVLADDFRLLEGKTYRMVVEYKDGDKGAGAYATLVTDCDLALSSLEIPRSGVGLTDSEKVSVRIDNLGTVEMGDVSIFYSVNGGEAVVEPLGMPVKAGERVDYTFSRKVDFSTPGKYEVTAWLEAEGDMLAANNTASSTCRSLVALDVPYVCDFSTLGVEGFDEEWMTTDANFDGSGWMYNEWFANKAGLMGVANCSGCWSGDRKSDDWLISMPLKLEKGNNHIAFSIRSLNEIVTETVEICVGTSPYPDSMETLSRMEICSTEWKDKAVNFEVDEDGIYYVAFHSLSQDGANLFVGDVTVGAGEFTGIPVVKIKEALVPVSNACLPSEARIGIAVTNVGTAPLSEYTLTAYVDDAIYSKDFSLEIVPDDTVDIYIDDAVDFSEPGTYGIRFVLQSDDDIEESVGATVECFEPLCELPILTNFTNDVNTGIWRPLSENAWIYDSFFMDFSSQAHGLRNGLLCRGFNLEYPARIKLSYAGGGFWTTGLGIYMGKAGTDPAEFDRVYFDDGVTSEAKEVEFTVEPEGAGCYSLVIVDENDDPTSPNHIRLNEAVISEVRPHDIRIVCVDSPLSAYIPAFHVGGTKEYVVSLENRGSLPVTGIRVTASVDGEKVSISEGEVSLAPGGMKDVRMAFALAEKNVGDFFTVSFAAEGNEEDGYVSDNVFSLPKIHVTKDVCASEDIETTEYGTGGNGITLAVGNVYTLSATADLTSVTVGLSTTEDDTPNAMGEIAFNIYTLQSDKSLGRRIYSDVRRRGTGGMTTLDIPDMRLAPGSYYFEVEQRSTYNMGLAYDPESSAVCYMRDGDDLEKIEYYALCIRAVFGNDAKVYAADGSAIKVTEPSYTKGLYYKETLVKGVVRNTGYENADIEVSLSVDGAVLDSYVIPMISYEEREVSFGNVDLSAAGLHRIELKAAASGDLNPENDICLLEIDAAEELSPYVMDFEGCNDFDASGDMWNPRWTTVDRNGVATTAFWRYDHKHKKDACGFMAFNPDATVPSMLEMDFKGMYAYEGNRFGLAFSTDPYAEGGEGIEESDVWIMSPKLSLGSGSEFELYVKTRDLEVYNSELEPYRILVSDSGDSPECFKVVGDDVRLAPVEEWEKVTVDLSEYDGMEVYVALQYIGKPVVNTCLMIDNLKVKTSLSDVETIATGLADVKVVGNTIIAPNGSRIFTISGMATGNTGLDKGIYIVRTSTGTCKVTVK